MVGRESSMGSARTESTTKTRFLRRMLWRPPRLLPGTTMLVAACLCLVGLGLLMVLSATSITSYDGSRASSFSVFARQAVFAVAGLTMMVLAALTPVRVWERCAWPLMGAGLLLLALPLVPGLGTTVNGSTNWLRIGGLQAQPSELFKPILAVWFAVALTRLTSQRYRPRTLLLTLSPVIVAAGLILIGGDLGTTLVLMLMGLAALFVSGVPKRYFVITFGVISVGVTLLVVSSPYRMARVRAMFAGDSQSEAEALGQHWQSNHGLFALASGGWTGVGLGASREKWFWLAEAHNDYIFAIVGEEIGLIGTLAVVALFGLIAVGLIRASLMSRNRRTKILGATVLAWIVGQALINMGVVTTLLPVIGVPLPLVSYGGSSLVATLTGVGIVLAFARDSERNAARPPVPPGPDSPPKTGENDQSRGESRVSRAST
ncbi:putative lipid II flippase FtsW [Brevibacterium renqingii]|uniref:putative lipid II flippase FtsW n=1 Tax=Brevibacterium renqingii TaxID=2776916 RepID=UPI001AE0CA48|nr:putative lipid II flippase FtsW [Brevibacterium renqingii]